MLKLAHITDPHISEEGELANGMDSRKKFRKTLDNLKTRSLHGIILTGDLAYPEGTKALYSWIREELEKTDIPYLLTPGNHDNPVLMLETFNLKDQPAKVILTGAVAMRGESLMFLDSSSERLTMKHRLWLARELAVQPDRSIMFMHHPPCECGIPFMDDKYPYKSPDLFQAAVRESGKHLTLFCGHYHVEKTVELPESSMIVHITPPTLGCLDPFNENYVIIDPRTGWREILIEKQEILETSCFYLEDL
jgi:Icc protein